MAKGSWLRGRLGLLAGLLLTGQGLLVATRVLDHEAPHLVGILLVAAGALLASWAARDAGGAAPSRRGAPLSRPQPSLNRARGAALASVAPRARALLVAGLGLVAAGGVLGYELRARSGLGTPEVAILVYGLALLAAAPRLDARIGRLPVATLVAYSFPLVLAPLALYAVNAAILGGALASPLSWYIRHLLVTPMAALLALGGIEVAQLDQTLRLATPGGALFLTVGVVCAGLYAGAVFLGIFALFAWESRTTGLRLLAYLALGVAGLHAANVLRLVLLGYVGYAWGGAALQSFHRHAGWVLFLVWTIAFWALVLRRFEGPHAGSMS